ncbi:MULTISPECIES: dTDP-glucose 4,6-dehydratase [Streptomyces]|uniref:dTDP-glucose 4,6-dehydratase n=1 Tax=Streptomyces albus (strain ATCC 21838 / DSM 41398 / FERM P-419 / JCM 4703 / NBRC 107858) TaxID=1081613 RepID=A0A0B5EHZ7_STRA4|nr:dTDP-glucose 4,6-dehydratase [Streptomyces sp. SCSIO ZS0520]AJE81054.1 dTDP-glucose 4,6-dehydratase [Streptomyces albus]AOU75366.1 dTDP-glucose 4,6-dehydratase [Streptomyces albus]
MSQTRILVTGGAGFIGSHYVRTLLGPLGPDDVSVTVLDAFTYAANPANLDPVADSPRYRLVVGDICDTEAVDALMAEHDEVVHFAAESHVDRSLASATEFVRTNVLGTQTLLDAALRHGVRTFVHVSTDEVYGSIPDGSCAEDQPLSPNSPYAASKAASDVIALAYHRSHQLDVRVTRCSNNYGHHQFPEKIIPLFVTRLLRGGRVPLYGDGLHVRDWLHIDDHVRGIELVRTRGRAGEVYNIGGGTELTNRQLTELLLEACGANWDSVDHVTDRKGHDRRYSVDWRKAHVELGYKPQKDFTEGLAETVAWYRAHQEVWEQAARRTAAAVAGRGDLPC